jgi:D-sedoheptulose 7-phosphate isomerase
VLEAFVAAKELGMTTVSLLGHDGGRARGMANVELVVPSNTTSRIQEAHIFLGHVLCEGVELALGLAG